MEQNFEKTSIKIESDESIIDHNLEIMKKDMRELSNTESMGGNAGTREIGGIRYSCLALNGYADKETGKILAFGNFQDISQDILAKGTKFTLIQGINIERKISRLVDLLKTDNFSERAINNINKAVIAYNEINYPSNKDEVI